MTKSIDNIICNVVILVCFILNIILEAIPKTRKWFALLPGYIVLYVALVWYSLSIIPGL